MRVFFITSFHSSYSAYAVSSDATYAEYNVQPLQVQTSGVVEVEPGGVANITCASNSQVRQITQTYRVCRVNYTKLDARQRCLREHIAPESDCCTADRCFKNSTFDPYSSNDWSYESALFMTSLPGNYQCQAINAWTSTWQSIGDPVRVVVKQLEEESSIFSTSVPSPTLNIPSTSVLSPTLNVPSTGVPNASFQIPLIASVSTAAVVIAVLLIVISALLCKLYRSKLKFSTQSMYVCVLKYSVHPILEHVPACTIYLSMYCFGCMSSRASCRKSAFRQMCI